MKARETNVRVDPTTGRYTVISGDNQAVRITSSDFTDDTPKSVIRAKAGIDFWNILKNEEKLKAAIQGVYPKNLQSLVCYNLNNVKDEDFNHMIETAPFLYKWLFLKMFKDGLTVENIYSKYYFVKPNDDYECNMVLSKLYTTVKGAILNTYLAVIDNYTYRGDKNTISKYRNFPLAESMIVATYNSLGYFDNIRKELAMKVVSEIKQYTSIDYRPVFVFHHIFIVGEGEQSTIAAVNSHLRDEGDYRLADLQRDLGTFYKAFKKYIDNGGTVSFMSCLGYNVANKSFEDSSKSTSSLKENENQVGIEEYLNGVYRESAVKKELVTVDNDSMKGRMQYSGINWQYLASLCKDGLMDVYKIFTDPISALCLMNEAGVQEFPNHDTVSLRVLKYLDFFNEKLNPSEKKYFLEMAQKTGLQGE